MKIPAYAVVCQIGKTTENYTKNLIFDKNTVINGEPAL
jgi:hypothetical protein